MTHKRIPPGQHQVSDFPVDFGIRSAVAHSVEDAPLADEHGGPVRLMVPKRDGLKSAKWLRAIEFHAEDRPRGYWEVRGYHNEADPWKEERYSND